MTGVGDTGQSSRMKKTSSSLFVEINGHHEVLNWLSKLGGIAYQAVLRSTALQRVSEQVSALMAIQGQYEVRRLNFPGDDLT